MPKGIRTESGRVIGDGPHRPIDDERRKKFLETLAETGSVTYAAAVATPHRRGSKPGHSCFQALQKRDPEFAQQVEEAKREALGRAEQELYRRAVDGWKRPIFQKGAKVGEETYYSDNLLLRLLQRLNPEWIERHQLEHSGKVQHEHAVLAVTPADVMLLSQEKQQQLVELLAEIGQAKEDRDVGRVTDDDQEGEQKALPGPAGEAKVTDVEPVEEGKAEAGPVDDVVSQPGAGADNQEGDVAAPEPPKPRRKRGRPPKRKEPEAAREPVAPANPETTPPPPADDAGPTPDELDDLW